MELWKCLHLWSLRADWRTSYLSLSLCLFLHIYKFYRDLLTEFSMFIDNWLTNSVIFSWDRFTEFANLFNGELTKFAIVFYLQLIHKMCDFLVPNLWHCWFFGMNDWRNSRFSSISGLTKFDFFFVRDRLAKFGKPKILASMVSEGRLS